MKILLANVRSDQLLGEAIFEQHAVIQALHIFRDVLVITEGLRRVMKTPSSGFINDRSQDQIAIFFSLGR